MSKKNTILSLCFGTIICLLGLLLWIFCVPNILPLLFDINENVFLLGSKWWLMILTILPIVFCLVMCFAKNKNAQFVFKLLFIFSVYEIFIVLISTIVGTIPNIGETPEISLTCYLFLPLSVLMTIFGLKLKHLPYKSKIGIRFKCTRETEFIWTQTHFYAQKVFFFAGILLFLVSVVFSFFHLSIIVFAIFVVTIIVCEVIVYCYSHSIYKKYLSLKTKHDMLQK